MLAVINNQCNSLSVNSNIHLVEFLTLQSGTAVHFVTVQATNLSNIIFVHMKMCLSTGYWNSI